MSAQISQTKPILLLPRGEHLYVGIDIGKAKHVAAFVSSTLRERHTYDKCPTISFENNRAGFEALLAQIAAHGARDTCSIVVEPTGHYHKVLEQYIVEHNITLYMQHVGKRPNRMIKSDRRDALGLARHLYQQEHLGTETGVESEKARLTYSPASVCAHLRIWTRRRQDLVSEQVTRKNRLTSICDQLFPELRTVLRDVNGVGALAVRARFPTPAMIVAASMDDLRSVRVGSYPSESNLSKIREVARDSIGLRDPLRLRALTCEQDQLIGEYRLAEIHLAQLDAFILPTINSSREGQILTSIPGIGANTAANLMVQIGSIARFPGASQLRSYLGWGVTHTQTGVSIDQTKRSRGGTRSTRRAMYMIAMGFARTDKSQHEWAKIYTRLTANGARSGGAVIGRIAGQIIGTIYQLLQADYLLVAGLAPDSEIPAPQLYDHAKHQADDARRAGLESVDGPREDLCLTLGSDDNELLTA